MGAQCTVHFTGDLSLWLDVNLLPVVFFPVPPSWKRGGVWMCKL